MDHKEQWFAAGEARPIPTTANPETGEIDVVWYGGAEVPRYDMDTGEEYMLRLSMAGCRMDRLNAGAPMFDSHYTGLGFKDLMAGKVGTKAQIGVVKNAWADGDKGLAHVQFDLGDPDGADLFRKVSTGIVQNLSFGAWIYKRELSQSVEDAAGNKTAHYVATDWEPFELGPCSVPADFTTTFLTAENGGNPAELTTVTTAGSLPEEIGLPLHGLHVDAPKANLLVSVESGGGEILTLTDGLLTSVTGKPVSNERANAQPKETNSMNETVQAAGTPARADETSLAAANADGQNKERVRVSEIRLAVSQGKKRGWNVSEEFETALISDGLTVEQARAKMWDEFVAKPGAQTQVQAEHFAGVTSDVRDKRRESMEAALLIRHDPQQYAPLAEQAREYRGLTLIEMARECLAAAGVKTRGMLPVQVAEMAMRARIERYNVGLPSEHFAGVSFFDGSPVGAQGTSDFPAILANVLNKSLRKAYDAYPATYKPFSRMVTAGDFKPIQRTALHDVVALQPLNEKGEYHRATLADSKVTYKLGTFGETIGLTRQTIINDDLQAFTRVPAILGVAAARLESDTVWAVITGNVAAIYPGDTTSTALFHANHSNLLSGGGSALGTGALGSGRASMRLMTAPNGTPLNLTPSYILLPAALETSGLNLIYPMNLAVTNVTAGVPEWIRSLTPVVEPRLDANSSTAWYLVSDPAQIDTIEYCYLEGQQGVYIETRQGFDVDGVEIKARLDFAAAAIDYRGLQKNAGV